MATARHFSTKSIKLLADDINSNFAETTVDNFLNTLAKIDSQIHEEFNVLKNDLSVAHIQLEQANTRCKALQIDNEAYTKEIAKLSAKLATITATNAVPAPSTPLPASTAAVKCTCSTVNGEHQPSCAFMHAILATSNPQRLVQLLLARERAYRNQHALVQRLKLDNTELRSSYDNLWSRYQNLHQKDSQGDNNIEHLSVRLQNAGRQAFDVATHVEKRLQITAQNINSFRQSVKLRPKVSQDAKQPIIDEYEQDSDNETELNVTACAAAADELIATLAAQKVAHDRLKSTVMELTKQLEQGVEKRQQETDEVNKKLDDAENKLKRAQNDIKRKDSEISDLKKQLTKVLAEYEAISVAHSYSNAELSRIRATNRAKTKERQLLDRNDRHDRPHALMNASENRIHHRKIHFR
ncbi:hypothetical protein FGB62_25g523 [Gracilaria domingensis]|nr:hypothetical protein FGB62_25g523 [Gracilaria domingensis]